MPAEQIIEIISDGESDHDGNAIPAALNVRRTANSFAHATQGSGQRHRHRTQPRQPVEVVDLELEPVRPPRRFRHQSNRRGSPEARPGARLHLPDADVVFVGEQVREREPASFENTRRQREEQRLQAAANRREQLLERQRRAREAEEAERRRQMYERGGLFLHTDIRNAPFVIQHGAVDYEDDYYEDDYDEDEYDEDYVPGGDIPEIEVANFRIPIADQINNHILYHMNIFNAPRFAGAGEQVPDQIMRQIEQLDNEEFEKRKNRNLGQTEPIMKTLQDEIETVRPPHTCKIDPEENYECELCGVVLGEGIPNDYSPEKLMKPLSVLQERHEVAAPFRALNLVTEADRDLSKRIFAAKCGHVYCGRCVKNVSSTRSPVGEAKKRGFKKTENSINNPVVYSPNRCVAQGCAKGLIGQKKFVEIYM